MHLIPKANPLGPIGRICLIVRLLSNPLARFALGRICNSTAVNLNIFNAIRLSQAKASFVSIEASYVSTEASYVSTEPPQSCKEPPQ